MKKKHIIWDWNGTLLDDIDVSMDALNYILGKVKLPLVTDKCEYRRYFQFPVIEYYKKVGFDFQKTPFDELADAYMSYYQPNSLHCHLHEGAKKALSLFHEMGLKQYILSASQLDFLKEQVAIYDIEKYFEKICGLDNIHAYSKAELAKVFVKESGFVLDEVVFVGDSVHDSEVATGAGCSCILIANGHEHKDKLIATGNLVIDSISELKDILTL